MNIGQTTLQPRLPALGLVIGQPQGGELPPNGTLPSTPAGFN